MSDTYEGNPNKIEILYNCGIYEISHNMRLRLVFVRTRSARPLYFFNLEKFKRSKENDNFWLIYQKLSFDPGELAAVFLWLFRGLRPYFGMSHQEIMASLEEPEA